MGVKEQTNTRFLAPFERFEQESAGSGPSWLSPLRKAAYSRFAELGFPTRHDEEWRYTDVRPIAETAFMPALATAGATLESVPFAEMSGHRLVFVNGKFVESLSSMGMLPNGVQISNLAAVLREGAGTLEPHLARYAGFEQAPFVALNTAFLQEGALVLLPRNAVVTEPIHLVFLSEAGAGPTVSHPRTLIVAGENSQATVIETYVGSGETVYFTNAVTEVVLADNAVVDHYKVTQESAAAYHIATMQVQLARSSNFSSHNITLSGALVRNDHNAVLTDEGAECTLNGMYLAKDRQLVDNHTAIDHAMPHCNSHELYKGILDGRARGVFNGKIFVRQDAQKTDAKQTNQTLLLSQEAQINTKPQLEIFADDVKCTHGATIGQLDAESLFYLRSRGIGAEDARSLLTYAFASDIIDRIKVAALRDAIHRALFTQLPQGFRAEEILS